MRSGLIEMTGSRTRAKNGAEKVSPGGAARSSRIAHRPVERNRLDDERCYGIPRDIEIKNPAHVDSSTELSHPRSRKQEHEKAMPLVREPHRIDRRQISRHGFPGVSLVS